MNNVNHGKSNKEHEQSAIEREQDKELLYHYCFNINDFGLMRFGITQEQLSNFKMLLLTMLGKEIAYGMNDNWLIVHGKDKHVIMYDKNNKHLSEDQIIKYYVERDRVPEDTLYLGDEGIELYSSNVKKIELHKAKLEKLAEHIQELIILLVDFDKNYKNESQDFKLEQMEIIIGQYFASINKDKKPTI